METDPTTPSPPMPEGRSKKRGKVAAAGLVASGLVAGGVLASTLGASADTTSTSSPSSSYGSYGSAASGSSARQGPGPGGAAAVRSDEKVVTGSRAATLTAAALKAVPGGTVIRVETDAGDGVYEAHLKKADGTLVTVKFDQNLKVTAVEAGMGKGDPAPSGGHGAGAQPGASAPGGSA
jgi:hypothetical protein